VVVASLSSGLVFCLRAFRDRFVAFGLFIVCSLHGTVSSHTRAKREVNKKKRFEFEGIGRWVLAKRDEYGVTVVLRMGEDKLSDDCA
jgi:hypothetical protein